MNSKEKIEKALSLLKDTGFESKAVPILEEELKRLEVHEPFTLCSWRVIQFKCPNRKCDAIHDLQDLRDIMFNLRDLRGPKKWSCKSCSSKYKILEVYEGNAKLTIDF